MENQQKTQADQDTQATELDQTTGSGQDKQFYERLSEDKAQDLRRGGADSESQARDDVAEETEIRE